MDVAPLRARDRDAQRVVDAARAHLAVAREEGKDRQPRRVGRGPALRTQGVASQVKGGARARFPAGSVAVGEGMRRLREDGLEKVREGVTSIAEIERMTSSLL